MRSTYLTIGALVIIVIVGLVVYSNTLEIDFVFDDVNVLVDRVPNRYADMQIREAFEGVRTFTYYTYALNYRFGELDVHGYHVVNVGLHVLNAVLVFWLAWLFSNLTFSKKVYQLWDWELSNYLLVAFAAGLVFVSHPIQTEGVNYLSQRTGLLAALFYFVVLNSYVLWRMKKKWWWVAIGLLAAVLAVRSKETAFTIPLSIGLVEVMFFVGSWWGTRYRRYVLSGWVLVLIVVPLYLLNSLELFSGGESVSQFIGRLTPAEVEEAGISRVITRGDFALTQVVVKAQYIRLLLLPYGQSIDHDIQTVQSAGEFRFILSTSFLLGLLAVGVWLLLKRRKLLGFGIFFFFIALLPESSIYTLSEQMVEYRLYLPMLGLAMVVGGLVQLFLEFDIRRIWKRYSIVQVVLGVIVLVGVVLSAMTYNRNVVWGEAETLWANAARQSTTKARPHVNWGVVVLEDGRLSEAQEILERAVEVDPTYALGQHNLGAVYKEEGKFGQAILHYEEAIELWPENAAAYFDLGIIYVVRKDWEKAIVNLEEALYLRIAPGVTNNFLGYSYLESGNIVKAEDHFLQSISADPSAETSYINLGKLYIDVGRYEEARTVLESALEINPVQPQAKALLQSL